MIKILDNSIMNIERFINLNSKKIRTTATILILTICITTISVSLSLTILNSHNKVDKTLTELRNDFNLEQVKKNNKNFIYQGEVFDDSTSYKNFKISINVNSNNYYFYEEFDDNIYEIKNDDGTLIDVYNNINDDENLESFIENKYNLIIRSLFYYERSKDVKNYEYKIDDDLFYIYSIENEDYIYCDYDGLLINGNIKKKYRIEKI